MSKHTKGPWEYEGEDGNYGHVVGKPGQCTDIAYCQEEANARLIAAAPLMYELLAMKAASGDDDCRRLLAEIGDV